MQTAEEVDGEAAVSRGDAKFVLDLPTVTAASASGGPLLIGPLSIDDPLESSGVRITVLDADAGLGSESTRQSGARKLHRR